MKTNFDFQPVIIVGAARSGTNMLRDLLTTLDGVETWPCDEINYIWRHGNASLRHDALPPEAATASVQRFIRRQFASQARTGSCRWLIEKTCANSLRVGFVDKVVPEAKYVQIVRDGRDVVASALKRWVAPLDVGYIAKKIRYVPPGDLAYYGTRYLGDRLYKLFSSETRLRAWGPRYETMMDDLRSRPLDEVCARQWALSVERADSVLSTLGDRVIRIRYEDFVASPKKPFRELVEFLGVPASEAQIDSAVSGVFSESSGGWKRKLAEEQIARLEAVMAPQLEQLGYELSTCTAPTTERRAA